MQPIPGTQIESYPAAPPPRPAVLRGAWRTSRMMQGVLFAVGILWFALAEALAGRAARGLADRFDQDEARPLLAALFLLFLLAVGYGLLEAVMPARRGFTLRAALNLPRRVTAGREWALGAAIGWGMAAAAVLPMALAGALHVRFWTTPRAFGLLGLQAATVLFATLAVEVALRGFPFRRLVGAIGPTGATAAMALAIGVVQGLRPEADWISILVAMVGAVLLSLAWLRTHGLWLGWGLHFAWSGSVALLFGLPAALPLGGGDGFGSVIQTRAVGAAWLTGDALGPEGALLTLVAMLVGIVLLVRASDDYAWAYTQPEIVAAGYEVNPPPPAAHTAMEAEAVARPAALVQILPTTPRSGAAGAGSMGES